MRRAHRTLLQRIDHEMRATRHHTGRGVLRATVRAAMANVPRHLFVPASQQANAYDNRPLPIGYDQTISQPFIVALMTELVQPKPSDVVLEIGTGCGYACAVLAEVVAHVHTIEMVPELAEEARERLVELGYENVTVHAGDGYAGWPPAAPYDAVLVTAAAPAVPDALLDQLAVGGRMIAPIGPPGGEQELVLFEKPACGGVTSRSVLPVVFVPMLHGRR